MNDLISRSALVAELESFKMSLGDIVFRFVVDRVIERVKAQPAAKPPKMKTPNGATAYRSIVWFQDLTPVESMSEEIEEVLRERWTPCYWMYERRSFTDHRCIRFTFKREGAKP